MTKTSTFFRTPQRAFWAGFATCVTAQFAAQTFHQITGFPSDETAITILRFSGYILGVVAAGCIVTSRAYHIGYLIGRIIGEITRK
jgi:rRNA processing protein Krr1/Pno1